jgi:hypothetical protein
LANAPSIRRVEEQSGIDEPILEYACVLTVHELEMSVHHHEY